MLKMNKILTLLLHVVYYGTSVCGPVYEETELKLGFLVFRHGDRTSIGSSQLFSTDPAKLRQLTEPYGFGQLTNTGIERAYEVGKFIRQTYNDLLSPRYNKSEIYIRSTDSTRTEMSVLAAMAAVYPPNNQSWNPDIHWTPTPYTTAPAGSDYNLAAINCPVIFDYDKIINSYPPEMLEYADLLEELAKLWYDFRQKPLLLSEAYGTLTAQMGLGLPLGEKLENLFPKIREASFKAWDKVYGSEEYLDVLSGVLLKSFFDSTDKIIAGKNTPKVRVLSAHDFTVYSLLAAARAVPRPGIPKYGSVFGLELRRVLKTGEYVVVPYYLSQPGEELQYLHIEGCDGQLCSLEQFRRLTSKFVLTEREWRTKCDITDADIDVSLIE